MGRELECGVLEFPDGAVRASTIGEIRVPGGVYDFETKYLDDTAELDVPAAVDHDTAETLRDLAIRTFNALDCQGLARWTSSSPPTVRWSTDQHHAGLHHHLDVPPDVGSQRG